MADYVLGTHDAELSRLGFQHTVWRAQAYAAWERGGFGPGHRLLDVGAGPGYTSLDLAELVGPSGHVLAVDQSERFVAHLAGQAAARGLRQLTAAVADAQTLDLEPDSLDGAYTRWLLCFVPEPERVIAGVARALRPGGAFVLQEYAHYRAMRLAPRSPELERVVAAVDASWRARGGDPDVGCRLPSLLERNGLEVREVQPLSRIARPGSTLWEWPATFFRNFVPALVSGRYLEASEAAAFDAAWAARSADPAAFFISPFMVDLVAVKR